MNQTAKTLFGTAGLSDSYIELGYKNTLNVAKYLSLLGLNAFEYQCGRGVRLSDETAAKLCAKGLQYGIAYSLHAPYYISMSSMSEETRLNSVDYIIQSAVAVKKMGGKRVVFHSGSCGKQSREEALEKAKDTLKRMLYALDENGLHDVILCPETMGKIAQLGTLEEVVALCKLDKRITPCVDFGHLNARTHGGFSSEKEFAAAFDLLEEELSDERCRNFHVHFSKIEYTSGGEKRHLTFNDTVFGPPFEPFLEQCAKRNLAPVIICESDGTQAEDAKTMMNYYQSICN